MQKRRHINYATGLNKIPTKSFIHGLKIKICCFTIRYLALFHSHFSNFNSQKLNKGTKERASERKKRVGLFLCLICLVGKLRGRKLQENIFCRQRKQFRVVRLMLYYILFDARPRARTPNEKLYFIQVHKIPYVDLVQFSVAINQPLSVRPVFHFDSILLFSLYECVCVFVFFFMLRYSFLSHRSEK